MNSDEIISSFHNGTLLQNIATGLTTYSQVVKILIREIENLQEQNIKLEDQLYEREENYPTDLLDYF